MAENFKQGVLLPGFESTQDERVAATSTFINNMSLPVHRWFRYSAGFSAEWVRGLVNAEVKQREIVLLDPFAGSGTALLAAEEAGVPAIGIEAHPFVARIARAKLMWFRDSDEFRKLANSMLKDSRVMDVNVSVYPKLIHKCFPDEVLRDLHSLRCAWEANGNGSPVSELTWLGLASILRISSPVGTAPWQYVLPKKTKSTSLAPYDAFSLQIHNMAKDMAIRQHQGIRPMVHLFLGDARDCADVKDGEITLVITSPPYANNYDYADAARLEMTFFGEVENWKDLHAKVRRFLLRSCSQHVSVEKEQLEEILDGLSDSPILPELREVCSQLEKERLQHGGKKNYHLMIAAYFADLNKVWKALRRVCAAGARVCFVIGDSAPYGVYVPVDRWLGELALAAGFKTFYFEKTRDRNVKWKNRKHRVPLHEGHLWVEG